MVNVGQKDCKTVRASAFIGITNVACSGLLILLTVVSGDGRRDPLFAAVRQFVSLRHSPLSIDAAHRPGVSPFDVIATSDDRRDVALHLGNELVRLGNVVETRRSPVDFRREANNAENIIIIDDTRLHFKMSSIRCVLRTLLSIVTAAF